MRRALILVLLLAAASAALVSVTHTSMLYAGEDNGYTLRVASAGSPVPNATVSLYKGSSLLGEQVTDADGAAVFILHPASTGLVAFRILADGYNEYVVFQEIAARPTPEPSVAPTPTPTATPTATPQPATAITGFITLNPNESGVFLFLLALVLICLTGSSYLYAKNLIGEEASGAGSWEDTKVLDGVARWLKGEDQHNNY